MMNTISNYKRNPQLVIPATFNECFTYEQQIVYLLNLLKEQQAEIRELEKRVELLENK